MNLKKLYLLQECLARAGGGGRGGGLVPVHCNLEEEPIGFVPHPFITVFSMHQ